MSDVTQPPAAQAAPGLSTIQKLALSAGAGLAGGGLLSNDVANMLTDLSKAWNWTWMEHPVSWAAVIVAAIGTVVHVCRNSSPSK